jgi:succinyl-diaminopimelate desuccinylase
MHNTKALKLAKELISLNSERPNGTEEKVAQFIFDYLKDAGLNPEKQVFDPETNRFNVLVLGSGHTNLMINGHIDTVPINDPKNWQYNPLGEVVGNKLYGRGSCDTKGNIACLLVAMTEQFNENVVYAFNVEEEMSLAGIQKVLELKENKLKHVKYSISLEPTDGKIMIGNRGQYSFEVTAKGKTAHASTPELGDNAIYKIAETTKKIEAYNKKVNKIMHPLFGHATASVGVIQGGTSHNVVPDFAKIHVDRRVLPNEDPDDVEKEFKALVAPLNVKFINRIEACESASDTKLVAEMQNVLKAFSMDTGTYGFKATTELSEISKHDIEGIIFGPGQLNQAHKPNEFITVKELEIGTEIFKNLLKNWEN